MDFLLIGFFLFFLGDWMNDLYLINSCVFVGLNIFIGMVVIVFILFFFIMLGNVLVVVVIVVDLYKELRIIFNYFILNLVVCDLFVGFSELLLGLFYFSNSFYLYFVVYICIYFFMVVFVLMILILVFE